MLKRVNNFFLRSGQILKSIRCFSSTTTNKEERAASFENYLKSKIKMHGPLTVADYMKEALSNPVWGYYMTKDVFGEKGDFTTSPEVSQMFGELIGVWFVNEWLVLKSIYGKHMPKSVQLVEIGPGRGTLMNDVLRTWTRQKETHEVDLNVAMIETSGFMRKMQFKTLTAREEDEPKLGEAYTTKHSDRHRITWISDINELEKRESAYFFLANEFFDALPVHKFQRTECGSYREILVDYDEKLGKFKYVISPKPTIGSEVLLKLYPEHTKHEHVEFSSESARYMEAISRRLFDFNGSALIIDYGHDGKCADTFRAFKQHKQVDPLVEPGKVDLTVDVDFAFLKHIGQKSEAVCYGPVTQGHFLSQMQIGTRLQMLLRTCKTEADRTRLLQAFGMLVKPDQMGERFKLMAVRKFDLKQTPPGFAPPTPESSSDSLKTKQK